MAGTTHHIYCDESRQTKDRYMVFGGVIVPKGNVDVLRNAMPVWRNEQNMHAELKWTKVSSNKLDEYKSLVDAFFQLAIKGSLHFRSVVFDTTQIDYAAYHKGDKELGFYKFFYHFLLHSFGSYARTDDDKLMVYLDRRSTRFKLSTLHAILNKGIRKKYGRKVDVVRAVEPVDSRGSDIIQIVDVIIGAIGYHNNDCHLRPSAKLAKKELAEYIAECANLESLKQKTPWKMRHFGIWMFQFSGRKK